MSKDLSSSIFLSMLNEAPGDGTSSAGSTGDAETTATGTDSSGLTTNDSTPDTGSADPNATDPAGTDDLGGDDGLEDDLGGEENSEGTPGDSLDSGAPAQPGNPTDPAEAGEDQVNLNPYIKLIYIDKLNKMKDVLTNTHYVVDNLSDEDLSLEIKSFIQQTIDGLADKIGLILSDKIDELEADNLEKLYIALQSKVKLISQLLDKVHPA